MNKKPLVRFDDFQNLANAFYRTVGRHPYDSPAWSQQNKLREDLIFYGGIINMNLLCIVSFVSVMTSPNQEEYLFMDIVKLLLSADLIFVANIKYLVIILNRAETNLLMQKLHNMFPKTVKEQEEYETTKYLKTVRWSTVTFSAVCISVDCIFTAFFFGQYLFGDSSMRSRNFGLTLPFPLHIPQNWQNNWCYGLLCLWQMSAFYTCDLGHIAVDLFFHSAAAQLIMHYDYVARTIENYEIKAIKNGVRNETGLQEDMKFICEIISYHNGILSLSSILNKVFGLALLVNLMNSCTTTCFCTFVATMDVNMEVRIEWAISLLVITMQVYFISYYGQMLINASTSISEAAFGHNWPDADLRYQKMLLLVMQRSQRPAFLTATSYVIISQGTMTNIFDTGYKFFCVLKNIYFIRHSSK